jgi:serine/threonine protein kinase
MTLLEGKILDRYTLGRLVGKGGMANVYEAQDQQFQRKVAVKVFKREDEEMLHRFIREAGLMASLRHEHLVPIIESGQCQLDGDTRYYLVMPYLDGGTLRARIRRSPPSLQESCRFLRSIGSALDYIHSQGIIHRDIKASNVLLSTAGECYLTDFGIARITNDATQLTSTGDVLGTVDYVAPELFEPERRADARSDLYSLGVLLYEMVTGRLPFTAESQLVVVSMHMNKRPPSPRSYAPQISTQVEGVIYKALEKRPELRYANATELANAFCGAVNAGNKKARVNDTRTLKVRQQTPLQSEPTRAIPNPSQRSLWFAFVLAFLAFLIITVSIVSIVIPRANNRSTGINKRAQHAMNVKMQGATHIPTPTPNLTATALAAQNATATARAQATATVITGLTVTVEAKASATAGVIQTATSGKPVYQDTLTNANDANTMAANWDQDNKCAFASDGYHVKEGTNWHICKESAYSYQNAAVTANLRILSGQTGGLLFRVNTDVFGEDSGYLFEVNNAGKFRIALFSQRFTATITPLLKWTYSAALRQGGTASNTLQVIGQGSTLSFYANGVFLVQLTDSTYSSGMIAFYATTDGKVPADVVYSNLKVYPHT